MFLHRISRPYWQPGNGTLTPSSCSRTPTRRSRQMTENPYLLMIATGTACVGRAAVREYYADHFLPAIPPDLELESLSQTIGSDRLVEEMVVRFTHTIEMDWLLPTLRPTG